MPAPDRTPAPDGWTGTVQDHHRQVGIFYVRVHQHGKGFRWVVQVSNDERAIVTVGSSYQTKVPTAEEARVCALARVGEIISETLAEILGPGVQVHAAGA